jgi:glycosyltransferase XagB
MGNLSLRILYFILVLAVFLILILFLRAVIPSDLEDYYLGIMAIILITLFLIAQGLVTLTWMLYAWENPKEVQKFKAPATFASPLYSFTALLPARHEEKVIKDTIKAINAIDYPDKFKEILVLIRQDDILTLNEARKMIHELNNKNIRLITFNDHPINKPHSLNIGLKHAENDILVIFDAEDEPHPKLYNMVNTIFVTQDADVVQSGVQLMNFNSRWFTVFNVLEYFFWFKSGLHFFTRIGKVTPLGGNTVFFKRKWMEKINGWDEKCLTEDADVGLRLSLAGAKTRIVYEEEYSTREEAPTTVSGFIKQRTRWNQGFIQIIEKGYWQKLPKARQVVTALYVLISPFFQLTLFVYIPTSIIVNIFFNLPVAVGMFTFIPLYLAVLQMAVLALGLFEFARYYKMNFPIRYLFLIPLFFFPYQLMLAVSSLRAVVRHLSTDISWEKTLHTNAHRQKEVVYAKDQI